MIRRLAAGVVLAAAPLSAQSASGGPDLWSGQAELSGSVFFGNNPQTVVTTRGALARGDSLYSLRSDARFIYGEATLEGDDRVTRRGWVGNVALDLMPFGANTPFLQAGYESSFEKRIRSRLNWGVGHKATLVRSTRSLVDVSLAILTERSAELDAESELHVRQLGRWSARVRGRRAMGERFTLAHETLYRPETAATSQFTIASSSSAQVRLTRRTALSLTLLDNYDSTARARGARVNNDGSLVAGLRADF